MEYNENTDETNEMENEDQEESGMKQWLQDNLRIIISVLIVVVIAAGIYSYSNRTIAPETTEKVSQEEDLLGGVAGDENISEEKQADEKTAKQTETEKNAASKNEQNRTSSVSTSQETEKSFVETAARGDGTTKLARRALANYLEKNPDASLTAEHKIYIEDYVRKNISSKGNVSIGQSVEFSKDLIQQGILKSKNLNQNQLNNLHKYAVRVPSLS